MLLTAFGVAILSVIYITGDTFEKQLDNNSKNIDLVIGAKGSPLQLILSTLYHVDNPTGNISLQEAKQIADNPLIQLAVPVSLGDNYKGHRIIGTDPTFLSLYGLNIAEGQLWKKSFEIVIGTEVAHKHGLQLGQHIHGAHGLSADAHIHDDHPFTIVGILEKANNVVDNLILCNLTSVWEVHGIHHSHEHIHDGHDHDHRKGNNHEHNDHGHAAHGHQHEEDHNHGHEDGHSDKHHDGDHTVHQHQHEEDHHHTHSHDHDDEVLASERPSQDRLIKSIGEDMIEDHGVEITALLIKYSSPSAIAVIPRMVNQSTHMQAASPAIESSRIFSLLGVGLDSLSILAYIIMGIAGLSIFISLYNALKERKYDMAIMRTMGATKIKLFLLILVEGLMITLIGGLIGLVLGHIALYFINTRAGQTTGFIEAFKLYPMELAILLVAIILGIAAALIPAFKAYSTTISKTLASK